MELPFVRRWLRHKQSRGHGIHSPFAFDLITNVIYDKHVYYAFHDIHQMLVDHNLESFASPRFNHLSFRLVNHFKSKNILEINSLKGINTCYLTAPASDIRCTCVEEEREAVGIANTLMATIGRPIEITSSLPLPHQQQYDAIFINLNDNKKIENLSLEHLLQISHAHTYWFIYPLKSRNSKQFWRNIVNDERITITFDRKDAGIAFLSPTGRKTHYWV